MENRAIIVDDEPATCELIEKVLTSAGIESLTVTKSEDAPEILRRTADRGEAQRARMGRIEGRSGNDVFFTVNMEARAAVRGSMRDAVLA
jgi:CheY-like chemotaxis protein